jgi:hypothetical protein
MWRMVQNQVPIWAPDGWLTTESQDWPIWVEEWDDVLTSMRGTPFPILHETSPAATAILDDETVQSISENETEQFNANVQGGWRGRYREKYLKWYYSEFFSQVIPQSHPVLLPELPPFGKDSQELLPQEIKLRGIKERYRLATVQEGINVTRPSEIPQGFYNDTKCRLLEEIQRHFLEPKVDRGLEWQLWSYEEVHEAYELRVYRFLLETGILRKEYSEFTSDAQVGIPQDSIEVRRVQWTYDDKRQTPRALTRIDTRQADSGRPGWDTTPSEPDAYIEDPMVNTMELTLCPTPDDEGTVGMRYVPMPQIQQQVECEHIPIPRMFSWAIKWGIMADLLKKEGEANDPVRAQAAEFQYKLGVQLARLLLGTEI